MTATATRELVEQLKATDQDFEWYPTTRRMIDVVDRCMGRDNVKSILDIGAGDGRVLGWLSEGRTHAQLYAIEKSELLLSKQPEHVIPVGTEFWEQDLMSLPVDAIFCNPPYSEYDAWAARIIETAFARDIFLVVPSRWVDSEAIKAAVAKRKATTRVIHTDDFHDAERQARCTVNIVRVTLPTERGWGGGESSDPFDVWFDQNIDTFEPEAADIEESVRSRDVARLHKLDSIASLVEAFNEDYARMQTNYKSIFRLDYAIFKELGVEKHKVREGLKARMKGLKHTYWGNLFDRLDAVTSRLTTSTKKGFLERLNGQKAVAFTSSNAYAVVLWAIKFANHYFDRQLVETFRTFTDKDSVKNYKSNEKTWQSDGWRYRAEDHSHYVLDYRVVKSGHSAIYDSEYGRYDYPGGLSNHSHELIDDLIAVFSNLGFPVKDTPSRSREWVSNGSQVFRGLDGDPVFEVKAFKNGNMHFRFKPEAIKALNIEAGRLLGWIRDRRDVVTELGYTAKDADRFFGSNQRLGASAVKLLGAGS